MQIVENVSAVPRFPSWEGKHDGDTSGVFGAVLASAAPHAQTIQFKGKIYAAATVEDGPKQSIPTNGAHASGPRTIFIQLNPWRRTKLCHL